ncbi:hypothetical protein D3C81_1643960 [compost metagenome]
MQTWASGVGDPPGVNRRVVHHRFAISVAKSTCTDSLHDGDSRQNFPVNAALKERLLYPIAPGSQSPPLHRPALRNFGCRSQNGLGRCRWPARLYRAAAVAAIAARYRPCRYAGQRIYRRNTPESRNPAPAHRSGYAEHNAPRRHKPARRPGGRLR